MDNICHTLAGAALGEAGLKRRTALGMATLLVASNLPDIDAAVFFTDALAVSFRRGWTHGVLAMAMLPPLLAGLMYGAGRLWHRHASARMLLPLRAGALVALSYAGMLLHVALDWVNSYGIRLLMPFSERWFYGDALYIVDPVLYAVLGGAILLARRQPRSAGEARARAALAIAGLYVAMMLGATWWASSEVRHGLARAGRANARFMVTPVFGNPFRREVIVDVGDRYEKGVVWFDPAPHFRPLGYGVAINSDDPAARAAAATPRARAFLSWSRFPFFVVERRGGVTHVYLNDYRYSGSSGRDGWAMQEFVMPEEPTR
jgi:inner membrane protein